MSFYRIGQNRKKRVAPRKKPAWDDTVQDLTVHKATPEEIMLRKEAHKSKNHLSVKLEKIRKEKQNSKLTGSEAQQLAIMKEILYDQNQLQEVLSKSDTMMAVVKDLFGDDPKRFMGFPNVTTAPHGSGNNSLVAPVPDIYTRTEKLSDSLMDQSALNDDTDTSDIDDEVDCPHPISYESKLNLQHFKDYLQEEKSKTEHTASHECSKTNASNKVAPDIPAANTNTDGEPGRLDPISALPLLKTLLNHSDSEQGDKLSHLDPSKLALLLGLLSANTAPGFQTPVKENQQLLSERSPPSAMNDTRKIKRSKKLLKPQKTSSESANTTSNMNDMRQVLQELENEIVAYENETGRHSQVPAYKTETFTGYTVALVSAVSRLTRYLREMDLRIRTEVTLREHLTEDVCQLRTIIDALATDLIVTREECQKLHSLCQHYSESTQTKLLTANNQIMQQQNLASGSEARPAPWNHSAEEPEEKLPHQHQRSHCESADTSIISKQLATSTMSTPLPDDASTQSDLESSIYHPLPTQLKSVGTHAAVMLSPPVRKTRVHSSTSTGPEAAQLFQCQTSITNQAVRDGISYSTDPPCLTQAPPVMNTVSVPRPVPLVQSNLGVALTTGLSTSQAVGGQGVRVKNKVNTGHTVPEAFVDEKAQRLQEQTVDEALNNPDMQHLMQVQLAELNRQQEEARHKLLDLLEKQKLQQRYMEDPFDLDSAFDAYLKEHTNWQTNTQKQPVSPPISPILEGPVKASQEREYSSIPVQRSA